ncbi:uncharacterized protein RHOBADRAFT_14989 [Rhodotorula graminis WP1]|uniref:Peptidase A22B, signal peptide peptidase n=1 Tax=Rhodotorula graminis (strain WP1) TaxID=578459 RepID=A0A194S253_RHOGW|nr:uncharacterized protein RHOBADRAFT_14989 [Rhodotorula graminis WP1]KPV74605.1 hypothetical protein RHOBADRAFT_14989 [Rhodotorula graminis WP1]
MASAGLYRAYAALLVGALVPIVAGSRSSLVMPKSAKRKLRAATRREGENEADREDDDDDEVVERMTREDAYFFPILGSCVLLFLFLCFKYLDPVWINRILGGYLATMAVGGLSRTLAQIARATMGEQRYRSLAQAQYSKLSFRSIYFYTVPVAVVLSLAQIFTGNWVLSNVVALAFAYNAISLLYLDSFVTGSILLGGLFFYDVWWVFGSKAVFGPGANVMVDVAKSFDAPIKIVFPKSLAPARDFTLLGLGDIVLPGVFLALALRFDYHLALERAAVPFKPHAGRFAKPYFNTCFLAYILGLATTILAMHTFRAAQPALLYLSPACVASVAVCALVRGESAKLWAYVDGDEGEAQGDEKKQE